MVVQSINKDFLNVIVEIEMSVSNFIRADETVNCCGDEQGIERGKLKRSSFCTKSKKEQTEKTNINKQLAIVIDLFLCEPKNDVDFFPSFFPFFLSLLSGSVCPLSALAERCINYCQADYNNLQH